MGTAGRQRHRIEDMYVVDENGCWVWQGVVTVHGYAQWAGYHAHRRVYRELVGPIPEGLFIDHLCRNKRCVNPAHLEAVTQEENTRRMLEARGRGPYATHCPQGHEYTPENIYIQRTGTRDCKECIRARSRAWKAKRRALTGNSGGRPKAISKPKPIPKPKAPAGPPKPPRTPAVRQTRVRQPAKPKPGIPAKQRRALAVLAGKTAQAVIDRDNMIREAYASGASLREIAEACGTITHSGIARIVKRTPVN